MKLFVILLLFASISLSHSTDEEDALLLLYLAEGGPDRMNFDNDLALNDSIETSDQIFPEDKEKLEDFSLPDSITHLQPDEDRIFYTQTSDTDSSNRVQITDSYKEILDNSDDNDIKKPPHKKKKVSHPASEKDKTNGESALYYLLSRLCYEIRIEKKEINKIDFGHKIYGSHKKEFRKKFGIEESSFKGRKYSNIHNYFTRKETKREKQCLKTITEAMAKRNMKYWEKKAKNIPDFEELKEMGDNLLTSLSDQLFESLLGETSLYYLLSRLCYEIRIAKKEINHIDFGRKIFAKDKRQFRKKFNIAEKYIKAGKYSIIHNYFSRKIKTREKQCLKGITEEIASGNMKYWERKAKKNPDFEELKEMGDNLLTSLSDQLLYKDPRGEIALYYILSRLCYEIRIEKREIKLIDFGNQIYGEDKKEFRKKFCINESSVKGRKYYNINNYFGSRKSYSQKSCPPDISKEIAMENLLSWKSKAENIADFEELKEMGDILLTTSDGKKPIDI